MKKTNLLKGILVILLSVVLVGNFVSYANAADDFDWDSPVNNTATGVTTDGNTNTNTSTNTSDFTDPDIVTQPSTNNTANTNSGSFTTNLNTDFEENETNTNENKANSLAYTGAEDTSILAIVIVLGLIVAAYSYKKIREYNSL